MKINNVLLKISGEFLKEDNVNVSSKKILYLTELIKEIIAKNINVAVVIGGGNFMRGRENTTMDKVTADTIGMLATVMNSLYLKDSLINNNISAVVTTPFNFPNLLENYSKEELSTMKDKVIIFGGGIGKSGFSTDSAVLNAAKICHSDLIIKLTNVDGVYSADPRKDKSAIKYDHVSYEEVLEKKLEVMDLFAIKECKENNIAILVTDISNKEEILSFFDGKKIGTLIA